MRFMSGLAAAVAVLAIAGTASAHPKLLTSTPAADAMLTASPPQVSITFNESLSRTLSGIELKDSAGKVVPTKAATPANDKTITATVLARLAPGTYEVDWHAVATDSHRVTGKYTFMVH